MAGAELQEWGTDQLQHTIFIGLDVHKATISVALAQGDRGDEMRHWGTIPNRADHVRKLAEKLRGDGCQLQFCYEAGPCGYGLHRQLTDLGHDCVVIAPSLIPVKAGDRVKTNRRGALMPAKLHRSGELTAVWVPDTAHEAMRGLVRARATAVRVTGKARRHLQGFLLRHGRIYPGKKGWTKAYRRWLTGSGQNLGVCVHAMMHFWQGEWAWISGLPLKQHLRMGRNGRIVWVGFRDLFGRATRRRSGCG